MEVDKLSRIPERFSHYDEAARPKVRVVAWQGSRDLAANARANCYAVFPSDQERFTAGDVITILLR